jgi:hypothetical protein
MSACVRKYNPAKWTECLNGCRDAIPADAITICLRTSNNTLSVWHLLSPDDECEFVDIAIAMTLTNADRSGSIDTIDFVYIELDRLIELGLTVVETPGNTLYESYRDKHLDISDLDYPSLGIVSDALKSQMSNQKIKRIERGKIKSRIKQLIRSGEIQNHESFPERLRKELGLSQ